MRNAKFLWLLCFGFIFIFSCKKEEGENINYTVLTEERILGVSKQSAITDTDIESLQRLIEDRVTDAAAQQKFREMLNSVILLKDILPLIEQLRINEEINFLEKYEQVYQLVESMTDLIPRKSILLKELEDNKNGYDNSEVLFSTSFAEGMDFWLNYAYGIKAIPGKDYIAFLRSDIDKVDSISGFYMSYSDLKKFTSLKVMNAIVIEDNLAEVNLNKFTELRSLTIELKQNTRLIIDSCVNLKSINVRGKNAFTRLDLNDVLPLLTYLRLEVDSLKAVFAENKPALEEVRIGESTAMMLDSVVIGGNHKTQVIVNSAAHEMSYFKAEKIKLLMLSGRAEGDLYPGTPYRQQLNTKLRKIDISNNPELEVLSLTTINFSNATDMAGFKKLSELNVSFCSFNSHDPQYREFSSDLLPNLEELESLKYCYLDGIRWPENHTLDLRKAKNLYFAWLHGEVGDWEGSYTGGKIQKLILTEGTQNNQSQWGDSFFIFPDNIPIEYVN
ncbi:hypothetical protein [Gynurincola endophyticus]|uniref:hypothetical protein n=1 Tax=Gynurincola endophyticus TaxID=2479004 RepID=UPI000F8E89E1|nr:hypothetical protein [Gynurincola endophyticus]